MAATALSPRGESSTEAGPSRHAPAPRSKSSYRPLMAGSESSRECARPGTRVYAWHRAPRATLLAMPERARQCTPPISRSMCRHPRLDAFGEIFEMLRAK